MKSRILIILSAIALLTGMSACDDTKSYAELLTDENHVVNSFLAQHRVVEEFPGADRCEVGPQAPYYKVEEEGNVYMQVLQKGDGTFPQTSEKVYFRYLRYDLSTYVVGSSDNVGGGNLNNMNTVPTYFLYDDYEIQLSSQYGTGIQIPVGLLGYGCKVNVMIKSQAGPTGDMSYVTPFLYTIIYNKPVM